MNIGVTRDTKSHRIGGAQGALQIFLSPDVVPPLDDSFKPLLKLYQKQSIAFMMNGKKDIEEEYPVTSR